jgi:hypothetical protein
MLQIAPPQGAQFLFRLTWGAARLRLSLYPRLSDQPLRGYAPFGGFPGLLPQRLRLDDWYQVSRYQDCR